MMADGNGVGQSIRTNASGFRVINADDAQRFWRQFQALEFPEFPNHFANQGRCPRHDTASGGAFKRGLADKFTQAGLCGAFEPCRRRYICLFEYPVLIRKAQVGIGIADIKEKNHEEMEWWNDGMLE